jgi:hypothetical protein
MTDIFSYLQTDATRFVSKVGATAWGSSSGSGNIGSLAIPTNQLIVHPFFVGLESITLTACGVQAVGGAGTNTVQFGIYNVLAPTARDVYPKTLVAEANTLSIAANGIAWSSGWATGSPVLTNGLYYLAALVGGAGTRSLSSTVDSDATFWLGSDTALNRGYMGFFTAHTAGTPLPSTFPLGATLFTNLDSYRIYVGMR